MQFILGGKSMIKRYMIYYPCISRLTGEEKSSNTLRDEQNLRGLKKKKISTT